MTRDEIEIPKELRLSMPEYVEETKLGQKNGAKKQYRYGNLHIREYDDKFLVHMDKVDPRKNPLGHLLLDAPDVLIGLASAAIIGSKVFLHLNKQNSNQKSVISSLIASVISGYFAYSFSKTIKNY